MKLLRKTKLRLKNKLGFTLIDLAIVIAVAGIVVCMLVTVWNAYG